MGKKEEGSGCWYIVIRLYWLVSFTKLEGGREGGRERQEEGGHKATREVKPKDFQCGYNFRGSL